MTARLTRCVTWRRRSPGSTADAERPSRWSGGRPSVKVRGARRAASGAFTGWTPRTIKRAKADLVKAGLVKVAPQERGAAGRFTLTGLQWGDRVTEESPGRGDSRDTRTGGQQRHLPGDSGDRPLKRKNSETGRTGKRAGHNADPRVRAFIDWFFDAWRKAFGETYVVKGGKEGQLVKSLLQSLDLEDLKAAALRMFKDPWARERGATIGMLSGQINTWQVGGSKGRPKSLRGQAGRFAEVVQHA